VLQDTFASECDIILMREQKALDLNSQVKMTTVHLRKINENLDAIIQSAHAVEVQGKIPSDKVKADVASVSKQVKDNEKFIEEKHRELTELCAKSKTDQARFLILQKKGADKLATAASCGIDLKKDAEKDKKGVKPAAATPTAAAPATPSTAAIPTTPAPAATPATPAAAPTPETPVAAAAPATPAAAPPAKPGLPAFEPFRCEE
jgi:hypothetical protein